MGEWVVTGAGEHLNLQLHFYIGFPEKPVVMSHIASWRRRTSRACPSQGEGWYGSAPPPSQNTPTTFGGGSVGLRVRVGYRGYRVGYPGRARVGYG